VKLCVLCDSVVKKTCGKSLTRINTRILTILLVAAFLAPSTAHAHTHLISSSPARGDTVSHALSEIRLTFSEAVDARYTVVTLLDATGQEVALGTLTAVGGSPSKEYVLTLSRPLIAGAFTVKWKAAGSDGHATTGSFDFVMDVPDAVNNIRTTPAATTTTVHPPEHAGHHTPAAEIPPLYRPESSIAWILTRWLNFLALVVMVGAVAFQFGVLERARQRLSDEALCLRIDDVVRSLAGAAAVAAIVSNLLRLWLQSGSVHGPERMFEPQLLSALIFKGGWGKAWLAQTVAAAGYLIATLIKTEDRTESWLSAAAFAVIAASTPAFSGHAAAVEQMAIVPVLDDAIHVIAASAWLGTLTLLLFAALPAAVQSENGFAKAAVLVNTFSPLALTMAGITVFTGGLNAFVHLGSISEFWTTTYGRVLAIKIAVVAITATLGAYNWRVVKPRLGTEGATAVIRKSASGELGVAAVIILVTAILVGTPTN